MSPARLDTDGKPLLCAITKCEVCSLPALWQSAGNVQAARSKEGHTENTVEALSFSPVCPKISTTATRRLKNEASDEGTFCNGMKLMDVGTSRATLYAVEFL